MKNFPLDVKLAYGPSPTTIKEITEKLTKEFEPKRTYSWILDFPKEISIPSYIIESIRFPVFGKDNEQGNGYKWGRMSVTMKQALYPNTAKQVYKIIKKLQNEQLDTFDTTIRVINPDGDVYERWTITGEIEEIDFDSLDCEEPAGVSKVVFVINVMDAKVE